MGLPIVNWKDLIDKHTVIEQRRNTLFYCMPLYKSSHGSFRRYFMENFNQLHNESREIALISFENPQDWHERNDTTYHSEIMGDNYQPQLSDEEVDRVCDHFSLHPNLLPAVILFSSPTSNRCEIFSLRNQEAYFCDRFFKSLFRHSYTHPVYENTENEKQKLIWNVSHALVREFPNLKHLGTYMGDDVSISQVLIEIKHIRTTVERIEEKVDDVKEALLHLQNDVTTVKDSGNDMEEKLTLMTDLLDDIKVDQANLQKYIKLVKNWLEVEWDTLEEKSQKYLPVAEFLFTQMSTMPDNIDMSSFILQYCRTLENELSVKVFHKFINHLVEGNYDIELLCSGFTSEDSRTSRFATTIKKYSINPDQSAWKYELGTMLFVINLTYSKKIITQSLLFQELKNFIDDNFNAALFNKEFIQYMEDMNREYRQKAAHPYIIDLLSAKKGKAELREAINTFLVSSTDPFHS